MAMGSLTRGPWRVVDAKTPSIREIAGPSFYIGAVMWATDLTEQDYQSRSADLRLIAAAPEMYALVRDLAGGAVDARMVTEAKRLVAEVSHG